MRWMTALLTGGLTMACIMTASTTTSPLTATPVPLLIEQAGTLGPLFGADINPLTGQPLHEDAQTRRPILVKISNSPADVRPQAGIGLADLVFEHYTEVGITRFSALYLANAPERVGSIRSARLIDYELMPMYQALLAFAGASLGVDKRIYGTQFVAAYICREAEDAGACQQAVNALGPVGDLPPSDFVQRAYKGSFYGEPIFSRDPEVATPHNLFVNLPRLWEQAERDGDAARPPLSGMRFNPALPPFDSRSGIYAQVRYLTTLVEWYYDPPTQRYYRSIDEQRHFDALTQQQVAADNVIILYAGHYLTDIVESGGGDNVHWSVQITLWPRGEAVLMRDGRAYEVEWRRETRSDLLTFWTPDGQPVALKPGQTWVQIVPLADQRDTSRENVVVE